MARLLPLLLALLVVLIVVVSRQQAMRPRSDRTYRPRAGSRGPGGMSGRASHGDSGTSWLVSRSELAGVRDAYSSAALDPQAPLYRCGGCLAFYHQSSLDALGSNNGGRCVLCASNDLRPVGVA